MRRGSHSVARAGSEEDLECLEGIGVGVADGVGMYLREIGAQSLLTAEEEVALAQAIEGGKCAADKLKALDLSEEERTRLEAGRRCGEAARQRFIEANLRLVVSIAMRFIDRGMPLADLIQEGNLGLFSAVEKFDYRKGWRFSTYATWWIRQAIARAIIDQSRIIRLPVHLSEVVSRAMKVNEKLEQELGCEPSIAELAGVLGVPEDTLTAALRALQTPASLELAIGEDDDDYLLDVLEDHQAVVPYDAVWRRLLCDEVGSLLNCLSERERRVVAMRFGLGEGNPSTLGEVGAALGVTRERIRQIETEALAKLSWHCATNGIRDYLAN